jgi:hypothetical protein
MKDFRVSLFNFFEYSVYADLTTRVRGDKTTKVLFSQLKQSYQLLIRQD